MACLAWWHAYPFIIQSIAEGLRSGKANETHSYEEKRQTRKFAGFPVDYEGAWKSGAAYTMRLLFIKRSNGPGISPTRIAGTSYKRPSQKNPRSCTSDRAASSLSIASFRWILIHDQSVLVFSGALQGPGIVT